MHSEPRMNLPMDASHLDGLGEVSDRANTSRTTAMICVRHGKSIPLIELSLSDRPVEKRRMALDPRWSMTRSIDGHDLHCRTSSSMTEGKDRLSPDLIHWSDRSLIPVDGSTRSSGAVQHTFDSSIDIHEEHRASMTSVTPSWRSPPIDRSVESRITVFSHDRSSALSVTYRMCTIFIEKMLFLAFILGLCWTMDLVGAGRFALHRCVMNSMQSAQRITNRERLSKAPTWLLW